MEEVKEKSKTIPVIFVALGAMVLYDLTNVMSALSALLSLHVLGMLRGIVYLAPLVLLLLLITNREGKKNKAISLVCILDGACTLLFHVLLNLPSLLSKTYTQQQMIGVVCVMGANVMTGLTWILSGILIRKGRGVVAKSPTYYALATPFIAMYMAGCLLPIYQSAYLVSGINSDMDMMLIYNFLVALMLSGAVVKPEQSPGISKKLVIGVCVVLLVVLIGVNSIIGGGGSKGGSKNVCSSCGRSFSAGDKDGNYTSITTSHMCSNCRNNFLNLRDFLGK